MLSCKSTTQARNYMLYETLAEANDAPSAYDEETGCVEDKTCADIEPPRAWVHNSCAQQVQHGMCALNEKAGFCRSSCGYCLSEVVCPMRGLAPQTVRPSQHRITIALDSW